MSEIVRIDNLSYSYNGQPVLSDINLSLMEKDFMAIIGPNGGGKTTLLKLILGFLTPDNGKIKIFGEDPLKSRKRIGYLPQTENFQRDFPISVVEVVLYGDINRKSFFPGFKKISANKAYSLLEKMQIREIADHRINEISVGQLQRTLLARAMMSDPELLILDEPTASVDLNMEQDIFDTLKLLNAEKTIMLVSHDIAFISSYVNKVTCLNKCSCTHKTEEISDKDIIAAYNGSIKSLHHTCKL